MINNQNFNALDVITLFSVLLQVVTYEQNVQQATNDDVMRELQKQNKEYFEKIIDNQNKILSILEELYPSMSD